MPSKKEIEAAMKAGKLPRVGDRVLYTGTAWRLGITDSVEAEVFGCRGGSSGITFTLVVRNGFRSVYLTKVKMNEISKLTKNTAQEKNV